MLPTFFTNDRLRLLFFGGKGGVGKTTSASASAIWLAGNHQAKKYLLISTDPAHSLFDSFEIKKLEARSWNLENLASSFQLPALGNLSLREFDAAHALEKFKKKYERQIKLITDRGTYFDNADINSFFNLSLPGIDEVMGILEIAELIEKREYDTVIIDTAPTGHTLSMLHLPELLDKWLGVFDLMEGKHHLLQEHFARSISTDVADDFLQMMHGRLKMVSRLLRDPIETEFVVVMIPEEVVLAETERLLQSLYEIRIPVHSIIVNRVSKNEGCPNCEKRGTNQRPLLSKIEAKASYKKIFVPVFSTEVHGLEQLKLFATTLERGAETEKQEARSLKLEAGKSSFQHPASSIAGKKLSISTLDHVRFVMVCGKGGVGKTTTAAATALLLAERQPKLRHQLYSIDPAHSLSDCFKNPPYPPFTKGGNGGIRILPNLNVYELDAQKLYAQFQAEYQDAIDDLFDQFSGGRARHQGVDFGYDRELLKELLATSPPGLSELMALNEVISNLDLSTRIILDTSPTGHFIRFLELPELVRSWLKAIFELLLKYRGVVQLNTVAEKLVSLSRNIRSVIDVITDNKKSCAVVVTIPEAMAISETERLISAIDGHNIRCAGVIVNMTTSNTADCSFCASRCTTEARWIRKADGLCKNVALIPFLTADVRGAERLTEFGKMVWR